MNGEIKVLGIVTAGLAACYGWLIAHITKGKHCDGNKVVYTDVCDVRQQLIQQQYESLKEYMQEEFAEVKAHLRKLNND
jgi:hypothetical protein